MNPKNLEPKYPRTGQTDREHQPVSAYMHSNNGAEDPLIILRLPKVLERTGLSRSTVLAMIKPGSDSHDESFPTPVQITARCVGWPSGEIESWLLGRINASRKLQK